MPAELAEPPTQENVSPGLRALFELPTPQAQDPDQPTEYPEPLPVDKTKRPEPPPPDPIPPAPDPVPPVAPPKAASDLTVRLAPDFAALTETPPIVTTDPAIDMPEKAPDWAKTPKQQEDYQKWRKSQQELHRQIQTLEARVSQAPAADTESKTLLSQVQEENKGLLERIERYNLMESPNFQREYLQPRVKDFQRAQEIVKNAGGDPVSLERIMSLSGKARIDALEELAEAIPQQLQRDSFGRLIEAIDSRTRDINERLANARAENETLKRQEKISNHQNLEKMEGELRTLLASARRDLADNVKLEVLQKVGKPGFEWWDEGIDEDDKVAEEILLKSTPEKAAIAAHLAARCGRYRSMWQAERKALAAANDEIAQLKGAGPKITQDRRATPVEKEGGDTNDILGRLQSGFYKT